MVNAMKRRMATKAAVPATFTIERPKSTSMYWACGLAAVMLAYALYHIVN